LKVRVTVLEMSMSRPNATKGRTEFTTWKHTKITGLKKKTATVCEEKKVCRRNIKLYYLTKTAMSGVHFNIRCTCREILCGIYVQLFKTARAERGLHFVNSAGSLKFRLRERERKHSLETAHGK
jgi:hypothetical protein